MRQAYLSLFSIAIISGITIFAVLASQQPTENKDVVPTPPPTPSPAVPTPTPSPAATPSNDATDTSQEQISIFNVQFVPTNVIVAYLINSGEYDVTIAKVFVDDNAKTPLIYSTGSSTIKANTQATLSFNHNWQRGQSYAIRVETANGKGITYVATVP